MASRKPPQKKDDVTLADATAYVERYRATTAVGATFAFHRATNAALVEHYLLDDDALTGAGALDAALKYVSVWGPQTADVLLAATVRRAKGTLSDGIVAVAVAASSGGAEAGDDATARAARAARARRVAAVLDAVIAAKKAAKVARPTAAARAASKATEERASALAHLSAFAAWTGGVADGAPTWSRVGHGDDEAWVCERLLRLPAVAGGDGDDDGLPHGRWFDAGVALASRLDAPERAALRRAAGDIIASAASGHAAGIAADTSDCGESAEGAGADADTPPPALVARAAALATALDAAQRRPPPFPHLPTAAVDAVRDSVLSRAGDVWGAKLLRRVGL